MPGSFFNCYKDSLRVKGTDPDPVIDEFDFEIIEPETATDEPEFEQQYRGKKV